MRKRVELAIPFTKVKVMRPPRLWMPPKARSATHHLLSFALTPHSSWHHQCRRCGRIISRFISALDRMMPQDLDSRKAAEPPRALTQHLRLFHYLQASTSSTTNSAIAAITVAVSSPTTNTTTTVVVIVTTTVAVGRISADVALPLLPPTSPA